MPKSAIIIKYIRQIRGAVFTTREISDLSGKSVSVTTQSLDHLAEHGVIRKVYRGLWAETTDRSMGPLMLVPRLFRANRVYVSFLSALHLHGVIGQIPRETTLASTSHSRRIRTALGVFVVHQISPAFFKGFDWYKDSGSFLVAEPEKALIDCLYLSARKKNQYGFFPELDLHAPFSLEKSMKWIGQIRDRNIRSSVRSKFDAIVASEKRRHHRKRSPSP